MRQAYDHLVSGEPESGAAVTLTIDLHSGGPTVTCLATRGDTVVVGSSQGRVYHLDTSGRFCEARVMGDGLVRAARRRDGTLGVASCGDNLFFGEENRFAQSATLIDAPRAMTMWGENVVLWKRHAIQLVGAVGRVRWSASFSKPVTHVAAQGNRLVCVAGMLAVFHQMSARKLDPDYSRTNA